MSKRGRAAPKKENSVGFKFKAYMPDDSHRADAIGLPAESLETQPEFRADEWFQPIPTPTHIDDWLAQYVPDNQTYHLWERSTRRHRSQKNRNTIYLVALGEMGEQAPKMADLVDWTSAFYEPLHVKVLPQMDLISQEESRQYRLADRFKRKRSAPSPDLFARVDIGEEFVSYPMKPRRCHPYYEHLVHKDHLQLEIDAVMDILEDTLPDDAMCLIAVTMHDLYEGDNDAFAVGMATGAKDRIGVFSFCRYDPLFDQSKAKRKVSKAAAEAHYQTLLKRSCKVLAHEIGHLVGIDHCSFYQCMMNGSGHLPEDFEQPMHLCPIDLRKILTFTGSTSEEYYQRTGRFFEAHKMLEESDWIKRRLKFIEDEKAKTRIAKKATRWAAHESDEEELGAAGRSRKRRAVTPLEDPDE